ncbi:MAG: hypothetical protein QM500_14000 [Methylococcales bacterium]
MLNLICINGDDVVYVETDCGKAFGIVNANHILDEDGLRFYNKSVCDVLGEYTDIEDDWDNESIIISFAESNGESSKLHIDKDGINLVEDNEQ